MSLASNDRFLKTPEILSIVGVSRATFYRLVSRNEFPAGHKIGSGTARRWLESEVNAWMASFRADDGDDY